MEITMQTTSHVLKIGYSLSPGATNEEAKAWLQEHATKNDFHEKMVMSRTNSGGMIGRVEHIDERSSCEPVSNEVKMSQPNVSRHKRAGFSR